jgi:carboxypeptidase family protein/TonB-dependent receptor-like protein
MTNRGLNVRRPLLVLLFLIVVLRVQAQTETATIRGSVADATGVVVPGATVRLIDAGSGRRTETATGNTGAYMFAAARPGRYTMEVEKSGFKLARLTGITLNVLENREQDFRLDVGPLSDSMTVEASAVNVNTTDGTVSTLVDRTFAENLPLNGRSFQALIMLAPGVVVTPTAFDDQGQFSVNGQRADANYFTVDGASANFGVTGYGPLAQSGGGALPALTVQGGTNSLVSAEAMQEFRVQTSSFAPEFGRTPGGQISIVTRSGTNVFQGTLFEYFRDGALDSSDWFVGFDHLQKPKERQNDFGGVFGGPIVRDKSFFFVSYEGLRLDQPLTLQTVVPDDASRQQAPAAMQPYLKAYPIANGAALGNGRAQFNASYSDPSSLNAFGVRVDHLATSQLSLFARFNQSPSSFTRRAPNQGFEPNLGSTESLSSLVRTFTLGATAMIGPNVTNELRANGSAHRLGTHFTMDDFGGAVPLPDSALFPGSFSSTNAVFGLEIAGVGELIQGKFATDEQRQINLVDNLSFTRGSHQLKFGVDYRRLSASSNIFAYRQFVQFSGVTCPPTPSCTGYALSGAAPGASTSASIAGTFAYEPGGLKARNYSLYGQDTWNVFSRLTVTYGLRWDVNPPLEGTNANNQPFTVTGLDDPSKLALAPRGTPLYKTTYDNLAPRIGAAYQLREAADSSTVLRGGFGIFYDIGSGSLGAASSYFPFYAVKILPAPTFPLSPADAASTQITTSPPVGTMIVADPHLKLPRTYQWNLAVEQSRGSDAWSLTYVGAAGRRLLRTINLLNPNPDFQFVNVTTNTATSDYNSLQAKYQRRLSRGLQAVVSYSWSHSIDIASSDAFANYLNAPGFVSDPRVDRGDSDFDVRHSLTAGVTYNLPSPQGKSLNTIFGGWSVDSFLFARSAPPVNVIGGYSFVGGTAVRYRPNVNPGVPMVLYGSQYPGGKAFNDAAFSAPAGQGDFRRNSLRGFGANQVDLAFQKHIDLANKTSLRFRTEIFNLFNHPNFGSPNNDLTSALFGRSTQTLASSLGAGGQDGGFNRLYQIGGPRSIQLGLKLLF